MKRDRASGPPRWAVWLMSVTAPEPEREFLLGDMEEEYHRVRREKSPHAAAKWFRRHALRSVAFNLSAKRRQGLAVRNSGELGSRAIGRASGSEGALNLRTWAKELRLATRFIVRRPLNGSVMIATLALGLGASMAIWSVVDGVLLEPMPYREADRLTTVWTRLVEEDRRRGKLSGPQLAELRKRSRAYEGFGSIWTRFGTLSDGDGGPEQIHIGYVTGNFFDVLGERPILGRAFLEEEDVDNGPAVIVLSHGVWQRRYGGDSQIVGRSVRFNGEDFVVVGVMPRNFRILMPEDAGLAADFGAWLPWQGDYAQMDRDWRLWSTIGRLRPQFTPEQAQAELSTVAEQLRSEHPQDDATGLAFVVEPLKSDVTAPIRPGVLASLGAVGFLLLIALANVANLVLLQAHSRDHEFALRSALGATRGRLLRQMFSENVLLFLIGGLIATVVAYASLSLLFLLEPPDLPRLGGVQLDLRAMAGAIAVLLTAGLVFAGLTVLDQKTSLGKRSEGGARVVGGNRRRRLNGALVVVEVALAVVLLIGAGLMLRSFVKLNQVDVGFESENVLSFQLSLPSSRFSYSDPRPIASFYEEFVDSLGSIGGVEAASVTEGLPLSGLAGNPEPYSYRSPEGTPEWGTRLADYRAVGRGYFEALGIELVAGRTFEPTDDLAHPTVAVIDDRLAESAWPGSSAIGKQIQVGVFVRGETVPMWAEVVGVVEHVRYLGLAIDGREQVYLHHRQSPRRSMTGVIRSELPPEALVPQIKEALGELDPERAVFRVRPVDQLVSRATAETRFLMNLMVAFAFCAAVLASIGIYGVMSQLVVRSTREIGVRRACGAEGSEIVFRVVTRGLSIAGVGASFGLVVALVLGQLLERLVFGVTVRDPVTFSAVLSVVTVLAIAACLVPAVRASRVDPIRALGHE